MAQRKQLVMTRILTFLIFMSVSLIHADSSVTVTNTGVVAYPSNFITANNLVTQSDLDVSSGLSTSNLSVIVDLFMSGVRSSNANYLASTYYSTTATHTAYYTDCVVKVLDPDGNILYFFSTVLYYSEMLQSMHAGEDIYDDEAIVYYYATGRNNYTVKNNNKLRAKTLFPSSAWSTHCIATYETALSGQSVYQGTTRGADGRIRITAIQIYPSARFRDLFTNPENSIVAHLQTPVLAELDGNGNHNFKPIKIQY